MLSERLGDAAIAAQDAYTKVTAAYDTISSQKELISAAAKAMLDAQTLDAVTRTAHDILEPVKKVVEGLEVLSTIHPFVRGGAMSRV